jgi:hypothetical protein
MNTVQDVLEQSYRKRLSRRYRIVAPRKRASYCVALTCTYQAGNVFSKKGLPYIRSSLDSMRLLFMRRVYELGKHELWLYQRGLSAEPHELNPAKLLRAFELFADCRPRCVIYMPPPAEIAQYIEHKPCNRSNFCPHCWASVAARQTQHVKKVINDTIRDDAFARLVLTSQITERFVSSNQIGGVNFATTQERLEAILNLREQIAGVKEHIAAIHKRAQRNTVGSIWRIVPIPTDGGWRLQLRQLFLSRVGRPTPYDVMRGMTTMLHEQAVAQGGYTWKQRKSALDMDGDIYSRLIEFNEYPRPWLTDDIELTAIYLNATAKCRLLGGTGKFKKIGSGLVRHFVLFERMLRDAAARRA